MIGRALAWVLALALLLGGASVSAPAAEAGDFSKGLVVGTILGKVSISGVPEIGQTLRASGVPAGSTCAWIQGGLTVSTSCTSYTLAATGTLTLQVTTSGKTTYAALTISGTPASTGTVGTAYTFVPGSSGGSGGNVFSQSGTLPPGVLFTSSTGALSGTPSTVGTYAGLRIAVTDSVGGSAALLANPFTITIASGGGGGSPSLDFSVATNSQYVAVVF